MHGAEASDEQKLGRSRQNTDSRKISTSYVGFLVVQAVLTSLACGHAKWHAMTQSKIRRGQATSETERAIMPHSFDTAACCSSQGKIEM